MSTLSERPQPLRIENLNGNWRVEVAPQIKKWCECDSEEDARLLTQWFQLRFDALEQRQSGEGFAKQLERLADALDKYRFSSDARFIRRRAMEAREPVTYW